MTGLRARGAVEVDIGWLGGKATRVVLRPHADGEHAIRPPAGQRITAVASGGRPLPLVEVPEGTVKLSLVSGREYAVMF